MSNKIVKTEHVVQPKDLKIDLSKLSEMDLSSLDANQKQLIMEKFSNAQVELVHKAQQATIDINATKGTLDNMTEAAKNATTDGNAITMTHTQTTSLGITEIVMGNTESAAKGKISRSASGLKDYTKTILVVAGALVITALILFFKG